ncbi:hypothetical protein [Aridibaculum aurantiacum]|uniref:hypothetical protein n=1 Tax=Aridibaculum aurantiacum TaxID=2810307 RepID=UPI001A96D03E|nr:hypothetical protein [Aridibaculum aurantiacum]
MDTNNNTIEPVSNKEYNQHLQTQDPHKSVDITDEEENHSTAADGGELKTEPGSQQGEQPADISEGNLPDSETISNNEDGEYDRGHISDK